MNALKKPLGPLPVYGWLLAISAGVLIFYWQRRNASVVANGSQLAPQAVLDPTQGAGFDMPSGLSAGGTAPLADSAGAVPSGGYPTLGQELSDVSNLAGGLGALYATMPFAPASAQQEAPTVGATQYDPVGDVTTIISQLRDAGLITAPATSTAAAASKPAAHTAAPKASARVTTPAPHVNKAKGNPRAGQTYRIVTDPKGHPKGRYHVYGKGKSAKYVRVSK